MKIRYTKPTKFDHGNFGDIYKVVKQPETKFYVQISQDPEKYNWIPLGEFFELALGKYVNDKDFFNKCLKLVLITLNPSEEDNSDKILEEII